MGILVRRIDCSTDFYSNVGFSGLVNFMKHIFLIAMNEILLTHTVQIIEVATILIRIIKLMKCSGDS